MEIAVVDDEKAIREHICALIEEQKPGSHIEAYATGGELLASGKRFDIVFLDIQMDGMNGIEAARKLRERQEDTVLIYQGILAVHIARFRLASSAPRSTESMKAPS